MSFEKCQGITKAGNPCGAIALSTGYCINHDKTPLGAELRAKRASRSGAKKSQLHYPPLPDTEADIYWIRTVTKATIEGLLSQENTSETREQARAIVTVINAYLKALEHEIKYGKITSEVAKLKDELTYYRSGGSAGKPPADQGISEHPNPEKTA